jgi:hypothetical protein
VELPLYALDSTICVIRYGKRRYWIKKIHAKWSIMSIVILFVILVPDHAVCY